VNALPPLFVNSMPKSGTNLVQVLVEDIGYQYSGRSLAASSVSGRHRVVKRLLRKNWFSVAEVPLGIEFDASVSARWVGHYLSAVGAGQYLSGHAAYSDVLYDLLSRSGMKTILVLRNPADVVYSMAKYIVEPINAWYPFHAQFKSLSLEDRADFMLRGGFDEIGGGFLRSLKEQYRALEGWSDKEGVLIVRFEDVVGEKGGGSEQAQRKVLSDIATFLRIDEQKVVEVGPRLFGRSHTFRGGQIGKGGSSLSPKTVDSIRRSVQNNNLFADLA